MEEDERLALFLDERAIRSLYSAVTFTLNKWTGQEAIDQEELYGLRTYLEKAILEYDFNR